MSRSCVSKFCVALLTMLVVTTDVTALSAAGDETDTACEPAMLVFDASGSMRGTRIVEARHAAARVLPTLARNRPVGLVTYGGVPDAACGAIEVRLRPTPGAGAAIQGMIEAIDPSGRTPLTASVQIAAAALGAGSRRGVVVLVTDGEENCGADPCALGRTLAARGGLLRVHVVGFRLRVLESSALACLARSTGGTLVEASDTSSLEAALRTTFGCTPMSRKRLGDAHARNAR